MQERQGLSALPGNTMSPRLLGTNSASIDLEQILLITLRLASRLGDETLKDMAMNLGRQPLANRRYLQRDGLAEEIGPSAEAVRVVEDFCQQNGFTLKRRALGDLFLTIEGEAGGHC